jgi:hypothetical protein
VEQFPPRKSKLERAARAAFAGAALLGAVGATEVPGAGEALRNTAMAQEAFDPDREAAAFLEYVSRQDIGIDDARGRERFRTRIHMAFDAFTVAYATRTPYYSDGSRHVAGSVSLEMRQAASLLLSSKLQAVGGDSPGLRVLRGIVFGSRGERNAEMPRANSGPVGTPDAPRTEVRRNRTDW